MTPLDALRALQRAGVTLSLAGNEGEETIQGRGPKPAPEILASIRAHRAAILTYLRARDERLRAGDSNEIAERLAIATMTGSPDLLLFALPGGKLDAYHGPAAGPLTGRGDRGRSLQGKRP